MRIFNKIDTPYTPETEGGIAGITHPHNLEQKIEIAQGYYPFSKK